MPIDAGSILMPVCRASRPRTSWRYSGTVKKTPMRTRFCVNRPVRPDRSGAMHQQVEVDERVGTAGLAVSLPGDEGPQQDPAGSDDEWGQGEPERLDGRVLRLDEPPGRRLQDAQDDGPETRGRQERAHDVQPRLRAGAERVPHVAGHRQDAQHEDDLAHEDDAPGQHRGGPAAEDGTDGDARAGDTADHRIRDLAVLAFEVARDQRRPSPGAPGRRRCPRAPTSPSARTATLGAIAVRPDPHA